MEQKKIFHKVVGDSLIMCTAITILKEKYKLVGDVRGRGLLWAVELVTIRDTKEKAVYLTEKVIYDSLKNGLSFKVSIGNVLLLASALTIFKKELKKAFLFLENALDSVCN
ncbi:hypothetical protein [Maribacter sp.]|uniref:hypothetical protein n=1 Tax=Maribacter sp. TaxID=1897614 RepID=UPI0032975132